MPQDKGVEIAQQLCAGLAAAHDKGVLHRDLKPANIMIDGRGHVRIWLYYVAFEPLVRRFWPDMLISTSRLFSGRFRSPRVGRDLLVGCLGGTALALTVVVVRYDWQKLLLPDANLGGRFVWSQILNGHQAAIVTSLWYLTFLLLVRILFRHNWLTLVTFTILVTATQGTVWLHPKHAVLITVENFVFFAVVGMLLIRFGLLCVFSFLLAYLVLITFPYALSGWHSHAGYFALGFVLLGAGYGYYTSTLAGRSLFGEALADTKRKWATR